MFLPDSLKAEVCALEGLILISGMVCNCALKFKVMRHPGLKCQSSEIMDLWICV